MYSNGACSIAECAHIFEISRNIFAFQKASVRRARRSVPRIRSERRGGKESCVRFSRVGLPRSLDLLGTREIRKQSECTVAPFDRRTNTIRCCGFGLVSAHRAATSSKELESSKSRSRVVHLQSDSDENLIDTGRCRRTKLCKVVGFRSLKSSRAARSSFPPREQTCRR